MNIKTIYKILGRYDICIEVDCEEELGSVMHYLSNRGSGGLAHL